MKGFSAPFWARGAHLQTVIGALGGAPLHAPLVRERLTLPDGDFVDLDWLPDMPQDRALLLILHGLEGSSRSVYIRRLLASCEQAGRSAVVMHFRGCSGEPNRLARGYHAGDTADLAAVVDALRQRAPRGLCAVGYSLGGSVLLKWLGETGSGNPLRAAIAVSVPFELAGAAARLGRGFSRLYQWALIRQLKAHLRRKARRAGHPLPALGGLTTFRAFDERVTAPLHGFAGADDYYARASCRPYLGRIGVPTLLIQAADDPFLERSAIPGVGELSPAVQLDLSAHGGHVGFVAGPGPWAMRFWVNERLHAFLRAQRVDADDP